MTTRKQARGQQRNLDQEEFDRLRAKMSPEALDRAVKGLGALARAQVVLREQQPGEPRDSDAPLH
jgi:hypothetical protein